MMTGVFGLILFTIDIAAILAILKSKAAPFIKLLWCLLVVTLPVLGLLIWFAAGPKADGRGQMKREGGFYASLKFQGGI